MKLEQGYVMLPFWIPMKLHLHGAEMFVYAIIHGYSQDGMGAFYGGIDYLTKVTDLSRLAVIKALQKLVDKKLIVKRKLKSLREFGINKTAIGAQYFCVYYTSASRGDTTECDTEETAPDEHIKDTSHDGYKKHEDTDIQNVSTEYKKCAKSGAQSEHNNIYNNKSNNKKNTKESVSDETQGFSDENPAYSFEGQEEKPYKPPRKTQRFVKPTVDEIAAYCEERGSGIDAQSFFDFYESKGWLIGKSRMKDWRACVRTWERRKRTEGTGGYRKAGALWGNESDIPEEYLNLL